jgi:hypothetical protein
VGTPLRGAEDARELDGTPVGVVRVYYSVDTPHVVDGVTYLRVQGASVPASDQAVVIELTRRRAEADAEARQRLDGSLPYAHESLCVPPRSRATNRNEQCGPCWRHP